MSKNRILVSFATIITALFATVAAVTVFVPVAKADEAALNESFTYQQLVSESVAAYNESGDAKSAKLEKNIVNTELYAGTPERPRAFTSVEGDYALKWNPTGGSDDWSNTSILNTGSVRSAGQNCQAVIRMTAKYDTMVSIESGAISATWAKDSYFETYISRDGKFTLIDSKKVGDVGTAAGENVDVAAGALDVTAHLAEGDSLYYAYRSDWGHIEGVSFTFSFDTEAYDPQYVPREFVRAGDDSADWPTFISNLVARNGNTYKGNGVDVDLFAGEIGSTAHFDTVVSDGLGSADDALMYGGWQDGIFNETSGRVVRWEARGNSVIRFTAKTDLKLSIAFSGINTWSSQMSYAIYAESGDVRLKLQAEAVTSADASASQSALCDIHMQKGDAAYFVIDGPELINIGGNWSTSVAEYSEDELPPYAEAATLIEYAEAKNVGDYSSAGLSAIDQIVTDTIAELGQAEDAAALINAAKAQIDAVPMGKDYADLVADVRESAGFGAVAYTSAEMGLYAASNPKKELTELNGKNSYEVFYSTSDKPDEEISTAEESLVCFSGTQILAHGRYSAVITVKAKKNMKVTVEVPQLGSNYYWVVESADGTHPGASVVYYINDGTQTDKVKSVQVVKTDGDYGYTAHLKEGEMLYYTVMSEWATVDLNPVFTFTDDYDENWEYEVIKEQTETFIWQDMVSAQVLDGGNAQSGDLVTYKFMYGESLDSLQEFDLYEGTSEPEHMLYNGIVADPSCAVWRWQWRVSNPYITVLKFEALENIYLDMTHGPINLGDYVASAYVKIVVEDSEGIRITRKTYVPKVNNDANAYFRSEHLAAGDKLYVILEPIDKQGGSYPHTLGMTSSESNTVFEADALAYDASLRADYAFEKELIAYRAAKVTEIKEYVQSLKEDDYGIASWMEINEFADGLEEEVADIYDKAEIDAAFDAVKALIDGIQTLAEAEEELNAYKAQKKAELDAYVSESDYAAEDWNTIQEYIDSAKASIDEAKSTTGVDTAVAAAKNRIDKIQKKTAEKGCGCGGAVTGGYAAGAVILLAAAAVLFLRKKEERI